MRACNGKLAHEPVMAMLLNYYSSQIIASTTLLNQSRWIEKLPVTLFVESCFLDSRACRE